MRALVMWMLCGGILSGCGMEEALGRSGLGASKPPAASV